MYYVGIDIGGMSIKVGFVDKEGNINCLIGKLSFTDEALAENFKALYDVILRARPAAVKGAYMKNIVLTSTMGPGVKVAHD